MLDNDMSMAAARPSDLKLNNRIQILELFKSGTVYSVADLAKHIGISRQTVMKAIQFFLEKGIIVSDGKASSGSMGGKRAELFTLSADRYLFNVLICPSCLYISLFNYRCEVIDEYMREDIVGQDVDRIMDAAVTVCDELLSKHGLSKADVRGVCLSTSGIFDRATGRVRYNSLFPAWGKDVPLVNKLRDYFGEDVIVLPDNVARVCGSAYLHGLHASRNSVITVFSRWGGVGACFLAGDHIVYGKDALIGEIGHMIVNPCDPEVCACGSRGCFERQVSVERLRSLALQWRDDHPESRLAREPLEAMTIQDVFAASEQGDTLGRTLSAYAATQFATALRNMTLMFNPDEIILLGDYASADDHFREILYRELRTFRYYSDSADGDNPFRLKVDQRRIQELTTLGAYSLLINRLFSDETTYL